MTMIGKKIRHFSIVAALGRGGMGDVYAGYDENLKRKVAIKAIQSGRGLTPLARVRFLREAQILSQLDHPGICRIYDYIEFEGAEYLILELIEGRTLSDAARRLDRSAKMDIARQIAQILDMAHGEGVVHRDLKPDNVMLTDQGQVKLLDFGLARSLDEDVPDSETGGPPPDAGENDLGRTMPLSTETTQPGTILGTPLFMSPEQASLEAVSPASDMFSFGLLLQWLFTGSYAYEKTGDLTALVEQARAARTLPARNVDRDLGELIERLKSRSPARRPTALAAREKLDWIMAKPRRRNRRLVTLAVTAAVLLAGFKYVNDLHRERLRAEQNRRQAEDLMGFMLGDLRDKLEPVGRLDVLDEVGTKALEYYAARREEGLGNEENFKLAKAMMQIGEVRLGQGDLESARQAFEEALITSEALVKLAPGNPAYLAGLGAVHFWVGSIDYNQGRLEEAEIRFRKYLDIGRKLVIMEPDNADWKMEVGYGYTNLAALFEERGEEEKALEFIHDSLDLKREMVAADPGDSELRYSLANSLGWAARMQDRSGRPQEALASVLEAEEVLKGIVAADPANTHYQELLAITLQIIAGHQTNLGRNEEALRSYEADLAIMTRLTAHDPDNAGWRGGLATTHRTLGTHLLWEGRLQEARPHLNAGLDLVLELHRQDPGNRDFQRQLAYSRITLARLYLAEDDPDAALAQLDASLAEIGPRGTDREDNVTRHYLGRTHLWRGCAQMAAGFPDPARASWRQARAILPPLTGETREPDLLVDWTRLMLLLGERETAEKSAATLAGMDFARRDFVDLCRQNELTVD
jgi:serine/threonine-protein kinase